MNQIYICSDIHGQYELYKKALSMLDDTDKLIVLGDAIDRGPDGILILQDIMTQKNVEFMPGNHEDFLLNSIDAHGQFKRNSNDFRVWTSANNGGMTTLKTLENLSAKERIELCAFLRQCKIQQSIRVDDKTFYLAHASFDTIKDEMIYQEATEADRFGRLWCSPFRDDLYADPKPYVMLEGTVIVGHVPVQRLHNLYEENPNKIYTESKYHLMDIDIGLAGYRFSHDKPLGVLCLNTMEATYLYTDEYEQEREDEMISMIKE